MNKSQAYIQAANEVKKGKSPDFIAGFNTCATLLSQYMETLNCQKSQSKNSEEE